MKKMIKAESIVRNNATNNSRAKTILDKATELFGILDDTDEEVFEKYDLQPLYDELNETIYDMAHKLKR